MYTGAAERLPKWGGGGGGGGTKKKRTLSEKRAPTKGYLKAKYTIF